MRLPRIVEPLRHRDFRLLWAGQTISTLGTAVHGVAIPWQVLLLTGSAVQLGIVVAISSFSLLVFALIGGVVVDRVPRRTVILASDLISGVVVALLATLSATGLLRIEHLYVFAFVLGASFAFMLPAMQAILPELVPQAILVQGNVLRGFQRQLGRVAGPALGGVVVGVFGPAPAFAIDAFTFLFSFGLLLAMRATPPMVAERRSFVAEILEGLRFTFSLTWLWVTIFGFALIVAAFFAPWIVALPILVRDVLGGDATMFGAINSALAVGEVIGGVTVAQMRVRRAGVAMYLYTAAEGVAMVAIGLFTSIATLFIAAAIIGVTFVGFGVLWETALQRHVPRELLGRVSSVDLFGALLLGPVAPIVGGVLVATVGPQPLFLWGGVFVVAFGFAGLLLPSIRDLE
ncbi:MAG: MFS transporter [Chloroflexota bacterium]